MSVTTEFTADCGCVAHLIKWSSKRNLFSMKNCPLHKAAPELLASLRAVTWLLQTAADEIDTDNAHPMHGYGGKTVRENLHEANEVIAKAEAKP